MLQAILQSREGLGGSAAAVIGQTQNQAPVKTFCYEEVLRLEIEGFVAYLRDLEPVQRCPIILEYMTRYLMEADLGNWKYWFLEKCRPIARESGIRSLTLRMLSNFRLLPSEFKEEHVQRLDQYIYNFHMLVRTEEEQKRGELMCEPKP
jgi:hypothetical protein